MDRRCFLLTALVGAFAAPHVAGAQPAGRVARVGLFVSSREAAFKTLEAVRQGMRERGWVEEQNLLFEERWAEGKVERLATFAEDLVRLKVGRHRRDDASGGAGSEKRHHGDSHRDDLL
jgi:putative ABC transport system substrate-binding protein